jgi:hypothetical protein
VLFAGEASGKREEEGFGGAGREAGRERVY